MNKRKEFFIGFGGFSSDGETERVAYDRKFAASGRTLTYSETFRPNNKGGEFTLPPDFGEVTALGESGGALSAVCERGVWKITQGDKMFKAEKLCFYGDMRLDFGSGAMKKISAVTVYGTGGFTLTIDGQVFAGVAGDTFYPRADGRRFDVSLKGKSGFSAEGIRFYYYETGGGL